MEVLFMGSAQSPHPPVVRLSGRAQAELRAGEALVFDWTRLGFCCAVAGEVNLRPTTLQQAQRSSAYLPPSSGEEVPDLRHRRTASGRTVLPKLAVRWNRTLPWRLAPPLASAPPAESSAACSRPGSAWSSAHSRLWRSAGR